MALISPASLTRAMHSRYTAVVLTIMAMAGAIVFYFHDGQSTVSDDAGFALPSPGQWITNPTLSFVVNVLVNVGIAMMMIVVNRRYNIIRAITAFFAGLFLLMQAATPEGIIAMGTGTMVAAVVLTAMYLIYGCYDRPDRTRSVFAVFALLSLASATQYAFVVYLPVFIIACAQMRILDVRTLVAALLGIITPWWILFGFGLVSVDDITLPHLQGVFSSIDLSEALHLTLTVGITAFATVAGIVGNAFKTIAYNARSRAVNGVLTVVSLFTIVAMVIDYGNLPSYLPLLNCCAAYEIAHFFAIHRSRQSYVGMVLVIAVYILLYLWRLLI